MHAPSSGASFSLRESVWVYLCVRVRTSQKQPKIAEQKTKYVYKQGKEQNICRPDYDDEWSEKQKRKISEK